MARSLTFTYKKKTFSASMHKLDRTRLYGSVRVITQDADEQKCNMATLCSDGKTLIPRGGTSLGYVNTEGEWIARDKLQPVTLSGDPVTEVASSFDAPVLLKDQIDAAEFLNHSVRLTYRMEVDEQMPASLTKILKSGGIFQFGFSYRGGIGYDPAFLLTDEEGVVWMLITTANDVQYLSLEQAGHCADDPVKDEVGNEDEDDAIDFGML